MERNIHVYITKKTQDVRWQRMRQGEKKMKRKKKKKTKERDEEKKKKKQDRARFDRTLSRGPRV